MRPPETDLSRIEWKMPLMWMAALVEPDPPDDEPDEPEDDEVTT